jgi:hypothetical protein
VLLGEGGEGEKVVTGVAHHLLDLGQLPAQHRHNGLELLDYVGGVGLGEDGADRGGHHLGVAAGHLGEHIAQEMHPAPLPARPEHHCPDGLLEAGVGVGDD